MYLAFAVEIPHPTQARFKLPIHGKAFRVKLLTSRAQMTNTCGLPRRGAGGRNFKLIPKPATEKSTYSVICIYNNCFVCKETVW